MHDMAWDPGPILRMCVCVSAYLLYWSNPHISRLAPLPDTFDADPLKDHERVP